MTRVAYGLVLLLLASALGLALSVSRARAFQVDEVEHLHASFNLERGEEIYRDFVQGHNPLLYAVLYPLADLDDPVASYRAARWLALVALVTTTGILAWCATRLAGRSAGLLASGLLLLHSTMVERGIEVRPDNWLALCVVAALLAELSTLSRLRRFCLEAVLLSLAFLFTQKAAVLCVPFGLLWLWGAARSRRPSLAALPLLVWATPVALMLGVLWWRGSLAPYWEENVVAQLHRVARTSPQGVTFGPWRPIVVESRRNLFFALAALPALVWSLLRRRTAFAGLLALSGLLYLSVNPFPFPYTHVAVLPLLSLLISVAVTAWVARLGWAAEPRPALVVAACLALATVGSMPRLAAKAALGNSYQLKVLRSIQSVTAADDAVFDMAGLYARPDAYPVYLMTGAHYQRYRNGDFPRMIPTWRKRGLVAIIENYRIHWLHSPEIDFLGNNMVYWGSNIYLSGAGIRNLAPGAEQRFEVLKPNRYRYDGPGRLLVDGEPFTAGTLSRGEHVLTTRTGIATGRLILDVPPSADAEPPRPLYPAFD